MKRFVNRKNLLYVAGVVVVVATSLIFFLQQRSKELSDKQQMEQIRSKVAKLILLPTDEDPTLATITDKKNLQDEFLKQNADNGDKILLYYKTKKVYIYRPSLGKLVATGPLEIRASASEVEGTRLRVRNGSTSDESANRIQEILKKEYTSIKLSEPDTSKRHDYPQTIVIDLTEGDKYNLVANIAASIGAQRGVLPSGETAPADTDILIITGGSE